MSDARLLVPLNRKPDYNSAFCGETVSCEEKAKLELYLIDGIPVNMR